MKWLKNYERVREIHQQLIWPTINEIDPRVYIPDVSSLVKLRNIVRGQKRMGNCELFRVEIKEKKPRSDHLKCYYFYYYYYYYYNYYYYYYYYFTQYELFSLTDNSFHGDWMIASPLKSPGLFSVL